MRTKFIIKKPLRMLLFIKPRTQHQKPSELAGKNKKARILRM